MKQLLCLFLTFTVFFAGCGTIIHGKYQTVPVSSNPIGAQVRSSSGQTCISPCELTLLRDHEYVMVASLEGYEPQQQNLSKDTSGWFWANIILGGIIGGVIDKASGSGDKLVPAKIHFDFGAGKVFGAKDVKSELIEITQDSSKSENESKSDSPKVENTTEATQTEEAKTLSQRGI